MHRRRFVATLASLAPVALAGCGSETAPPPRQAEVFANVELSGSTMEIELAADPEVESRIDDVGGANASLAGDVDPAPIGAARAAKGGRGATGRGTGGYSSAPTGRHGWAVYHGHDDDEEWRENHEEDVRMYDATVATLGVAFLATDSEYEDDPPGTGPVPWDRTWDDPDEGTAATADLASLSPGDGARPGWYRVGAELVAENGSTNFGWNCADMSVETGLNATIDEAWHVRPRL